MKKLCRIPSVVGFIVGVLLTTSALASVDSPLPFLPPGGTYYTPLPTSNIVFSSSALMSMGITSITLSNLWHTPGPIIANGYTWQNPPGVSNYWDNFDSSLTGDALINFVPQFGGPVWGDLSAAGAVLVTVQSYTNGITGGPFSTEMSLNWTNVVVSWDATNVSFAIQCPSAPGQTTVTALQNGMYNIDSYFDVFTEISFDGVNWISADGRVRMILVPEPSSFVLLVFGAVALAVRVRRSRR
jgi:hypothetical protein